MTQPELAEAVPGRGRHYRHPRDNTLVPSITNCLNVINKPLVGWASKETAKYAWRNRHALAELDSEEAACDLLKGAPNKMRDSAADLGTVVHDVADALAGDRKLPDYPAEAEPIVESFLGFVADFNVDFLYTEATVFSSTHRYAGTLDCLADVNGTRAIVELKTSGKGPYHDWALQIAAQAHAEEMVVDDDDLIKMPSVGGGYALHIGAQGYSLLGVKDLDTAFAGFLAARRLWDWMSGGGSDSCFTKPLSPKALYVPEDPFEGLEGVAG